MHYVPQVAVEVFFDLIILFLGNSSSNENAIAV